MKNTNKLTVILFITLLFSLSIFNILNPDKEFSYNENRYLTSKPEFTIDNLIEGKYTNSIEKYMQDQFIFRDNLIMVNAVISKLTNKLENNNVYMGKEGYLFNKFDLLSYRNLELNVQNINDFNHNMHMMLLLDSNTINNEYLKEYSYNDNMLELSNDISNTISNKINYIDMYTPLKDTDDSYFMTDHHWNHNGSYIGYKTFMNELGIEPIDYTFEEVSNEFKGTLYSKSGLFYYEPESIYKIKELDNYDYTVTIDNEDTYDSIYFNDRLKEKDKYLYYCNDNYGHLTINNNDSLTNKKLLIIKDSYANIMIPYLIPHFKQIEVIDMRDYIAPVSTIVEEQQIDEILLLYSLDAFVQNKELAYLR